MTRSANPRWLVAAVLLSVASTAAADVLVLSAPEDQEEAAGSTIERLERVETTEELLRTAPVARDEDDRPVVEADVEGGARAKVRFRITLETPDGGTIEGLFKARQRRYRDWIGELMSYALGRALGIRLTPTVERCFARPELEPSLRRAERTYDNLLEWEGEGDDARVCGSFTYWVPEFSFRIGRYSPTPETLDLLTERFVPTHRERLAESRLLQELTAVILLDYLVFNEDRPHNVGTVRLPGSDEQLLVPIDFGDTLYKPEERDFYCRRWLWRIRSFPAGLVDALRALEPEAIRELLAPRDGGHYLGDDIVQAVLERREDVLVRIGELLAEQPEETLYEAAKEPKVR